MEKHLLKLIQLADELNLKQDKVFAEIHYSGDDSKKLEIHIRSKKDYKYVEKVEMQRKQESIINWESWSWKNGLSGRISPAHQIS